MATTTYGSRFGNLTRRKEQEKEFNIEDIQYLSKTDKRMRFNTSKDPIYYVFDVIEDRPIKTLAKEFVKDSIVDAIAFVTKVVM